MSFQVRIHFSRDFEETLTIDDYCLTYGMDDTVKIKQNMLLLIWIRTMRLRSWG